MSEIRELVRMERLRAEVAEIRTIDDARKLMDKAAAARVYAKKAGFAREAWNDLGEIHVEAQARAGEILREMRDAGERVKGGEAGRRESQNGTLALKDFDVTKSQSSRWQRVASVPEPDRRRFYETQREQVAGEITSSGVLRIARQLREDELKKDRQPVEKFDLRGTTMIHGDFSKVELPPAGSIDCIITDPPYGKEHLGLLKGLSLFASKVLLSGGSLFCMFGQAHLPAAIAALMTAMDYHWTLAYLTPGGQSPRLFDRKVNTFWKPIVWLTRGRYRGKWLGDVLRSPPNDNDKRFHEWGQSEGGFVHLVELATRRGETVCDPLMGAATTGIAALRLGRKFYGIEKNASTFKKACARLGWHQA